MLINFVSQLLDVVTSNNALLPDDIYSALDRALMPTRPGDGYDEFSLFTSLPNCVALRIQRQSSLPVITQKRKQQVLADVPPPTIAMEEEVVFENAPEGQSEIIQIPIPDTTPGPVSFAVDEDDENLYTRAKRLFGIEKELWLERYACANRAAVSRGRAVMKTLAVDRVVLEDQRDVLAKTQVSRCIPVFDRS